MAQAVKAGIPYALALEMTDVDLLAWVIMLGEAEGHHWDFQRACFVAHRKDCAFEGCTIVDEDESLNVPEVDEP